MRILAISDVIEERLYNPGAASSFANVDLVLSCGDLPWYYLEYLVTTLNKPLYYVFGNHEPAYEENGERLKDVPGCVNLDGRVVQVQGLLIAGLEGSIRYRPHGEHQYTEWEMWGKIIRLLPKLMWNRITKGRYLDILVTHAPPAGIHDAQDRCHQGFRPYLWFMERFSPRYLIHGHTHMYMPSQERQTRYKDTEVINAYGYVILDVEPAK
ncbi:MAG: metallophosphoesterase family protein [Anaerolineae bacterium]